MKAGQPLIEAIEKLYEVFSRYPMRKPVEGCPCCVSQEDKDQLASKPLRKLSRDDLQLYAVNAITTWGSPDDFRHFLPRIFELLVSEDGIGVDGEVVFGKLALGEWLTWSEREQTALREYFHAGWNKLLADEVPVVSADTWLCGLGCAGENLESYLEEWLQARTVNAYKNLVVFFEWNNPINIKQHSLSNAFWPGLYAAVTQVCNWFASPATRERFENIFLENEGADFGPPLADVIYLLELMSKS